MWVHLEIVKEHFQLGFFFVGDINIHISGFFDRDFRAEDALVTAVAVGVVRVIGDPFESTFFGYPYIVGVKNEPAQVRARCPRGLIIPGELFCFVREGKCRRAGRV